MTAQFTPRRVAFVAGLLALLITGGLARAADASAAPGAPGSTTSAPSAPGTSSAPRADRSGPASKPPKVTTTWGVQPSTAKGPNGRAVFSYPNVKPGTVEHDYVGISNFSSHPVTFQVYAADGFVSGSGQVTLQPAAQKPTDVGAWVHMLHKTITVPAHARVNEPFTLTVPANATPGDHTGGVLGSISKGGKQVKVDERIGVPIYLRVSGSLLPNLRIEGTSTSYHGTINPIGGGSTDVSYTVHNTGNVRLIGAQTVRVTGPFGITLATVHPPDLTQLLPGQSTRVRLRLPGVFPAGPLTVHVRIRPVQAHVPGIGELKAEPRVVSYSKGMWAIPWPQLLFLILLVGAGFGVRWLVREQRRRRAGALAAAVERGRREAATGLASTSSNGNGHVAGGGAANLPAGKAGSGA